MILNKIKQFIDFIIVFTIVIDMGGELGIRKIGFILLILSLFHLVLINREKVFRSTDLLLLAFFILYPTGHLFYSISNGFEIALSISQVSVFYFSLSFFLFSNGYQRYTICWWVLGIKVINVKGLSRKKTLSAFLIIHS